MSKVYAQGTPQEWVNIGTSCLNDGSCTRDIYDTLNIREDIPQDENTFEYFTQDIFLSATFFIGTVVTFALVFSWLLITLWWASEGTVQRGKDGVKWSLVWLVLVMFSYTIIRGVQFIAQGN